MDYRSRSGASLLLGRVWGFTLIEVLSAIAVVAILGSIGVVMYRNSVHSSRVTKCIAEIKVMQIDIDNYYELYGEYPVTLADVGHEIRRDPWDRPYSFLRYDPEKKKKGIRKDKNLKPLNSAYDLFSMGPDGEWKASLSSKTSRDDIIRANDGEFIGIAERY